VVTNPPYGVRVGDAARVRDLWAQLGHVLRARAVGWRVALLSPVRFAHNWGWEPAEFKGLSLGPWDVQVVVDEPR
jgi:23S rRNA G2445 N2-methylase RlmL